MTEFTQTLAEVRAFIERNWEASADRGDPIGMDYDNLTSGEREAYNDGKADAYAHVLQLLAPGRIVLERNPE